MEQIRSCQLCPLHKGIPEGCTPIPGVGPIPANIMIVDDQVSYNDMLFGEPLSDFDWDVLGKVFNKENVYLSSVVNCIGKAKTKEINTCKDWLFKQLNLVKPKCVILLGTIPTKVFINFKKFSLIANKPYVILGHSIHFFPVYHPNYIIQRSKKDYDEYLNILRLINGKYS